MNELTITFDTENGKHLYEQIYEYIKKEIRAGQIAAGEKLPSARALAEHLMVSRSTVNFAYEQLLSEGYIEAIPCKGYFACQSEELFAWNQEERTAAAVATAAESHDIGQKESVQIDRTDRHPEFHYDFSPHAVDMSLFPFSIWRKISRQVLLDSNTEMMSLGHPQGDIALRTTIAHYLHQARGVLCDPEQIVVGAGNDYLLILLQRILGDQVEIAMENPTYPRAYRMFESFGYHIHTIPMDNAGMRIDKLRETACTTAYVMPSHQFPMGIVMPIGRRMELLKWAAKEQGRYLIEDDYDSEFRFRGKPVPALQASDTHGKVIYIGTFSKSIAPAIRTSYMVLPRELLTRYRLRCGSMASTVSRVDQAILCEFIRSGAFERHLNKMRKCYREKHDLMLQELKPLEKYFEIEGSDAGLYLILTSRTGLSETVLQSLAAQQNVRVYGLSENAVEAGLGRENSVLLGFGGITMQNITEGIGELRKCWL